MTQLPQRIYFRANGEANIYSLIDQDAIKWVMALLLNGEHTTARQVEILERMAACWNACQGIETEELEIITDADETFSTLRDRHIAQRNELLEALQSVWLWMENQADGQSKGGHATFDLMMLREQRDIARAAIAKATGGNNV